MIFIERAMDTINVEQSKMTQLLKYELPLMIANSAAAYL